MTGAEYETEDNWELHVAEAEVLLDMTEADIKRVADALGMPIDEYRAEREKDIANFRLVDPLDLTPDQYRRLFRREPGE
jgi:hypothetical protein